MALAIQKAIEEGSSEYDLLEGSESYKFHWTSETRELSELKFYSPGVPGLISRKLDDLSDNARKLARRNLPQPLADRLAILTRP
jgi:CelD/BcsL family acetyltransferase involved in cellulose biosynthesis